MQVGPFSLLASYIRLHQDDMSSSDDAIISKLSAKVFGIKELMKSLKRHSRTIQAEETDEDKPKATCPYLPDEIWLNIIEQFPGEEESIKLHRESHGGWNGKLIEDTLDWQYGLVSLSATCKVCARSCCMPGQVAMLIHVRGCVASSINHTP